MRQALKINEIMPGGTGSSGPAQKVGKMQDKAKMLQSQRIDNLGNQKQRREAQVEEDEEDEIKGQGVDLHSQNFVFENELSSSRGCLSCLQPSYNIKIETSLDKVLYFAHETV